MRNSSFQKEQVYQELVTELTESSADQHLHGSSSKPIRLFSMYIANYTNLKSVEQINQESVKTFFSYLLQNHKRLSLSLADIKKTIKTMIDILGLKEDRTFTDFSLSNSDLWNNIK